MIGNFFNIKIIIEQMANTLISNIIIPKQLLKDNIFSKIIDSYNLWLNIRCIKYIPKVVGAKK